MNKLEIRQRQCGQLAAAVRKRRKLLGLTQQALGLHAGVGVAFIYHLETGKPTVRLDKVLDVLEVLGLQLVVEAGKEGLVDGLDDPGADR